MLQGFSQESRQAVVHLPQVAVVAAQPPKQVVLPMQVARHPRRVEELQYKVSLQVVSSWIWSK